MRVWLVTACVMTMGMGAAQAAGLTTLVSFTNTKGLDPGADPQAGLIVDSSGDLFGTTTGGGATGVGTVFELTKGASSYTFNSLVAFNRTNGRDPFGALLLDSSGNLYGTTASGGSPSFDGNVFKLTKSGSSYSLSTLATFTGTNGSSPVSGLIADSGGNLFGTASTGAASGYGTAFELVKNASSVTTLVTFNGTIGGDSAAGLIMDSSGDLFGTTSTGGSGGNGTVFELIKGASSYTLSTLASFTSATGNTYAGLIVDGGGNLFGTTYSGGSGGGVGTVFELAKGASGYTLSTLASFDTTDGANPDAGLIEDGNGDLFGTTLYGGTSGDGTAFELVNGALGYAMNTLASFNGTDGANPYDGLIADSSGDLFGTASAGGTGNNGTVFEITNSGFVVTATAAPEPPSWALLAAGLLAVTALRRRTAA